VNDTLKRLRDAVSSKGREVEVAPDGSVHEVDNLNPQPKSEEPGKATKLAPRTFGLKS